MTTVRQAYISEQINHKTYAFLRFVSLQIVVLSLKKNSQK